MLPLIDNIPRLYIYIYMLPLIDNIPGLYIYAAVDRQHPRAIYMLPLVDNIPGLYIYIYRSVPLIRPPILYTTSSLKWGEGLYSNMQLVSNISSPPPPPQKKKSFTRSLPHFQSSCLHKNTVTKVFYTKQLIQTRSRVLKISLDITFTKLRGLPTSEKSCQFNARSITFTTTSL